MGGGDGSRSRYQRGNLGGSWPQDRPAVYSREISSSYACEARTIHSSERRARMDAQG